MKNKLVPLAETVNGIGIRGVKAADVMVTRLTLLAILDNLAADEAQSSSSQRRALPSRVKMHRDIEIKEGRWLRRRGRPALSPMKDYGA